MGLTLIVGILIAIPLYLLMTERWTKTYTALHIKDFKQAFPMILLSLLASVVLAFIVSLLTLSVVKEFGKEYLNIKVVDTTRYNLLPFENGTYIATENISNRDMEFVVRTETGDQHLNTANTSIEFNSNTVYMEKLEYDFKSNFLRWLLFKLNYYEYRVYTSQDTIDGLQDTIAN